MPPGRPPLRVCGLTAVQWAEALGPVTPASLRKAQRVISGTSPASVADAVVVARAHNVDVGALAEALYERQEAKR